MELTNTHFKVFALGYMFYAMLIEIIKQNKLIYMCYSRCTWYKQACLYVFHSLYMAQTRLFVCIPSAV